VADGRQRSRDERDDLIKHQHEEIQRLREELARAERERRVAERDRDRVKRQTEHLKQQLDAARRAGFRQAAPFAKPHRQGAGRPHGRTAGPRYGRRGRRPIPRHIDERHEAPLPTACPACGGALRRLRIATQYQEELPPVQPIVRAFRVHIGCCRSCHRRVQGRHPLQASDALGAAAVQLGPQAVALGAFLHQGLGLPLGRIVMLFRDQCRLHVTRGALVRAFHRLARRAAPSYAALCAEIRGSPVVTPDETGWKVDGDLHWLWTFTTPETTVYASRPGRGFDDAVTILGAEFRGVLVRDGWAPYRRFTQAVHQTCLAHLLRRCRELRQDYPQSPFAARLHRRLQQALMLRDRYAQHALSEHGFAVARGRLLAAVLALIADTRSTVPAGPRFLAHLTTELPALLTFLGDPAVDATNWRAEHAIRPAVVVRKVCGGNRSPRGAQTQEVLASILRTSAQRRLAPTPLLTSILCARTPTVPAALTRHHESGPPHVAAS
jgi:transposase